MFLQKGYKFRKMFQNLEFFYILNRNPFFILNRSYKCAKWALVVLAAKWTGKEIF